MTKRISIEEAAVFWLKDFEGKSAFFESALSEFIYLIRETKMFRDYSIKGLRKDTNVKKKVLEIGDYLVSTKLVDDKQDSYFVIDNDSDELEILCSLYDVGYVSYLSAMRFYNFTNRIPKRIDYVAPSRSSWKEIQNEKISDIHQLKTPYPSEKLKIKNKHLNVYARSSLYNPKIKGKNIRIIGVGELFLEMIRYPDLCGGFQHVFEIYEDMADALLDEIIDTVELYGTAIDKSRIGFIIESHLGIKDSRIMNWKKNYTSRGGSRKMISNSPYSDIYSEDWCISLNHSVFK